MTHSGIASLSFTDLRDRLKAHAEQLDQPEDILDRRETLRYLMAVPDNRHTAESVDALIQLARNFEHAAQPLEALQAVSQAARHAAALKQKSLLCAARGLEGITLSHLGRFAEAITAQVESWSLARDLGNNQREIWATSNLGIHCSGMGQFKVAIHCFERARALAEHHRLADSEFNARVNLAASSVLLRQPAFGLQALSQLGAPAPQTRIDMVDFVCAHHNLARLHLMTGDLTSARAHATESARLARTARLETLERSTGALLGLIDVCSGAVETGLAAVERALSFARSFDHTELSEYLDTCIDAYEAAGYSDKALEYLQELAALRRKTMNAAAIPLKSGEFAEAAQSLTDDSLSDNPLLARAHLLEVRVNEHVQRLLEIAINAEMASGYDLYRPFRVGNLARCLGAAIGWNERRVASLALGGQLCNIGMMAIPTRVLLKSEELSEGEWHLVHDHPRYGAELLSRSKMQALDVASLVAEQHHERYDGKGYPHGLSGEAISEEARIVAICDAFDAVTHQRPWRVTPLSIQAALNELGQAARSQFDPLFVRAFVDVIRREVEQHDDFDAFLAKGADEFEYVRARARMDSLLSTPIQ